MACNCSNSCNSTCTNPDFCGCLNPTTTDCVTWKGTSLSCGDVVFATQGDTLNEIFTEIKDFICDLTPSGTSGTITVVDNVDGETTVTSSTVGDTTTYVVGIADAITDQIDENTTNIADLFDCVADSVSDIISSDGSLSISVSSTTDCGRTLDISYNPSGTSTIVDGIVYNSVTFSATNGTGSTQTLKTFTRDYITENSLSDSDEIKYVIRGQIVANGSTADTIKVEILENGNLLDSNDYLGLISPTNSSFEVRGDITVSDISGEALHTIEFNGNTKSMGTDSNITRPTIKIAKSLSGVDFSALEIRVRFANTSTSTTGNGVQQLKVEVRKFIG